MLARQIQTTRLGEIGTGAHQHQESRAAAGTGKTNGGLPAPTTGTPTTTGSATSGPAPTEPNQNPATNEAASHLAKTDAVSPNSLRTTWRP